MTRTRWAGGAAHLASASRYPEQQPAPHPGKRETAEDVSAARLPWERVELPPPVLGERYAYYCESCDHETDATYSDKYRIEQWLIGSSRVDRCPQGEACLALTCEWLSAALGVDVNAGDLKQDPRPFLLPLDQRVKSYSSAVGGSLATSAESPRSEKQWSRCVAELRRFRSGRAARDYLRTRGIDPRKHDLGLTLRRGYDAIVARCYCKREVTSEAFRSLDQRGRKNDVLTGCSVGWIGAVLPHGRNVLLVAGFFDAFAARQHGLPAASAIGTNLPDHLLPDLEGKSVAVAYDVGEEDAATRTVAKLVAKNIPAFVVDLGRLGLPHKGDLTDYFAEGGSAQKVNRLIRSERRRS